MQPFSITLWCTPVVVENSYHLQQLLSTRKVNKRVDLQQYWSYFFLGHNPNQGPSCLLSLAKQSALGGVLMVSNFNTIVEATVYSNL